NVQCGSLADIRERIRDVRLTPKSGHVQRRNRCLLSANCEIMGCDASSGRVETTGALRGGAPFWGPLFAGFRQSTPHTIGIKVLGVCWRAWLLARGRLQPSGTSA